MSRDKKDDKSSVPGQQQSIKKFRMGSSKNPAGLMYYDKPPLTGSKLQVLKLTDIISQKLGAVQWTECRWADAKNIAESQLILKDIKAKNTLFYSFLLYCK